MEIYKIFDKGGIDPQRVEITDIVGFTLKFSVLTLSGVVTIVGMTQPDPNVMYEFRP